MYHISQPLLTLQDEDMMWKLFEENCTVTQLQTSIHLERCKSSFVEVNQHYKIKEWIYDLFSVISGFESIPLLHSWREAMITLQIQGFI